MNVQQSFDADVTRAMSRRQFMARLARAAGAAVVLSSPVGCGTVRGAVERARLGEIGRAHV